MEGGREMDLLEAAPAVESSGQPRRESKPGFGPQLAGTANLSPQALVTLCGVLLVIAVLAGALTAIHVLRDRELARAQQVVLDVNRTLADKTVFAIQGIDLVLRMTVERHGDEGAGADGLEVHKRLRERIRLLTQARELFVTDNQGQILHSSRSSPPPRLNLADRAYFHRMRDADNLGVFVSRPDQDRVDPWRTFHFSRRLETPDGRFDGVAVALVDVDYITAFYQGSGVPSEALIRLIRNDGVEISRFPRGSQPPDERPAATATAAGSAERFARIGRSAHQLGNPVLVSAFPLSHYPLELEVSLPNRVALEGWKTTAWTIALMAAIAALAIAYYIRKFVRHLGRYHAKSVALEENEERFELVVQASMAGVFDCALPVGRLRPSPRFRDLLGLPESCREMDLADFYALIHPEDVEAARGSIEAHLTTRAPLDADCRFRSAKGTHTWFNLRGLAVWGDDGSPVRLVGGITDIEQRRALLEEVRHLNEDLERRVETRTQELQAANRELEAFAYSVSHDLRSPLRAIDGFSSLVLIDCGSQLSNECKDYLTRSRNACRRMSQIIDDLLLLSRVTRGPLKREDIDLSALAYAVAGELRNDMSRRNVRIHIEENLRANADAGLVRILLQNLIGNAWKFTAQREDAAIAIGVASDVAGRRSFFVQDNGAGFDMSYSDKLFRPFQRLHTSEEFPGTGIGLATALRIVQRHGGLIWATAEPGAGATFYFTLDPSR